jgi:hypothetical protein
MNVFIMEIASILEASGVFYATDSRIVHTGRRYGFDMCQSFFKDPGLPAPDHILNAGPDCQARLTERITTSFESPCLQQRSDQFGMLPKLGCNNSKRIVANHACSDEAACRIFSAGAGNSPSSCFEVQCLLPAMIPGGICGMHILMVNPGHRIFRKELKSQ